MARIEQLPDGTYIKALENIDLDIAVSMRKERFTRAETDKTMLEQILALRTQIDQASTNVRLLEIKLNEELNNRTSADNLLQTSINQIQIPDITESYSKDEINHMLIPWRIEEIPYISTVLLSNQVFDKTSFDKIKVGYEFYYNGRLKFDARETFSEQTIRRYSIDVFTSSNVNSNGTITLAIECSDECVVSLNKVIIKKIAGNGIIPEQVILTLKTGWNNLQILIKNCNNGCKLDIGNDLTINTEALRAVEVTPGMISRDCILPYSIEPRHLSASENFLFNSLQLKESKEVGVWIGNEINGTVRIGDGYIIKQEGEPWKFNAGGTFEGSTTFSPREGNEILKVEIPWGGKYAPYTKAEIDLKLAAIKE